MIDLSTTYLGLRLAHPVVAAASPLSGTLDGVKRLAAAGASAIVLESLFEEQIDLEFQLVLDVLSGASDSYTDAVGRRSGRPVNRHRPGDYVRLIQRCRDAVQVPIIASLNGVGTDGWLDYALQFQSAGAHAIELNLYYLSPDPDRSPRAESGSTWKLFVTWPARYAFRSP